MILSVMQPYFFPYLGYFLLIKHADTFVSFDTPQYIDRGWVNRNRIIHQNRPEAAYITVPLQKHPFDAAINQVEIDNAQDYRGRILGQVDASYKKRAPFFRPVRELLLSCLEGETQSLARLNELSLIKTCEYLGLPFNLQVFSRMDLQIDPVLDSGEWGLNISKAMGASRYINAPGGMALFDQKKFDDAGIDLRFLKIRFTPYEQKKPVFLEGLSILDVMMFNPPEKVLSMLDDYDTLTIKDRP